MGHQERTGGEVTFALRVPVEFARQAIVHKGMWVQKEATKKFRPGTPLPKQKYKLAIQGERPLHPSVLDAPEVSMEWGLQHHIAKTPAAPATRKQPYGPVLTKHLHSVVLGQHETASREQMTAVTELGLKWQLHPQGISRHWEPPSAQGRLRDIVLKAHAHEAHSVECVESGDFKFGGCLFRLQLSHQGTEIHNTRDTWGAGGMDAASI